MTQSRPMTLLMTRPSQVAEAFVNGLQDDLPDLPVVYSPVMKIVPTGIPNPMGAQGLVFTSQNAVRLFADGCLRRDLPAYCVGERTTLVARSYGFVATQVGHNAETLISDLPGRNPPTPLLHVRGTPSIGDVAQRLSDAGLMCREQEIYRQQPVPLTELALQALDSNHLILLPIFSPRSAKLVSEQVQEALAPLVIAWMSPAVRDAWDGPVPLAQKVAAKPEAVALRQALLGAIATVDQLEGARPQR